MYDMICMKCGNQLNEGDLVCSHCGEPINVGSVPLSGVSVPNSGVNIVQQPIIEQPMQGDVNQAVQGSVPGMQIIQSDIQQPVMEQPVQEALPSNNVSNVQTVPTSLQQPVMEQPVQVGVAQSVQEALPSNNVSNVQTVPTSLQQPVMEHPVQQPIMEQSVVYPQLDQSSQQLIQQQVQQPVQPSVQAIQQSTNMGQPTQVTVPQPAQNVAVGNTSNNKGGKNTVLVVIILLCLIVIGVLVYIIVSGNTNINVNGTSSGTETPASATNNGGSNGVSDVSGNSLSVAGYTVNIPSELKYEVEDNVLAITDEDSMIAMLTFVGGDFSTYKNDPDFLKSELQKQGISSVYSNSSFGDKEFLIYKYYDSTNNINGNYFVSEEKSGELVVGVMYEDSNYLASKAFLYIVQIMNNAVGSSTSNFSSELSIFGSSNNSFMQNLQ